MPAPRSSRSAATTPDAKPRSKIARFVDRAGTPELVVFALTVATGIWAWLTYAVRSPQDFPLATIVILSVAVAGGFVQILFATLLRADGLDGRHGSSVVFWGPTVIWAVVFPAITPPHTSAAGFDPDMNIYQVMGLLVPLSLAATGAGVAVLYGLIAMPVVWLIAALAPGRLGRTARRDSPPVSRREFVCGALIIWCASLFGVAMYLLAPDADAGGARGRMRAQFHALVTLQGDAVWSAVAIACVVAVIALVVLSNRATAARRRRTGGPS